MNNKTPYEVLFGKSPEYTHIKPFGCLCFVTNINKFKDKFQPRAKSGVFLGYPFGIKGYKILLLETFQIVVSRYVIFHETIFSFHNTKKLEFPTRNLPIPILEDLHSVIENPVPTLNPT